MKKLIALLTIAGFMTFGISNSVLAQQEENVPQTEQAAPAEAAVEEVAPVEEIVTTTMTEEEEAPTFHEVLKKQYIDGGWGFMTLVLIVLVLGLAISIERIIYLTLSTTNTKKLVADLEKALNEGGIEKAKELCRNTRGPVASICYQGLLRIDEGMDVVERSIVSYGGVQSAALEKNCSWVTLFIAMAPSLGFLGTVIGMVMAFDDIQKAGDISPTVVAGGMKVALITTIFGIIVALVLQVFYNFILSKIEALTTDMEDSSITLLDLIMKYNLKK